MSDCRSGVSPVNYPDPDPGLPGWDCNHRSLFDRYVDSSQTLLGCTYMMFCDLQYVEGSLAVVGKLVYADWLLVFCSFFV